MVNKNLSGFRALRPKFIREFEEDAKTQAKFHLGMAYFWILNFPIVLYVFIYQPGIWNKYGVFYVLIASLYANFATDFGALSGAQASMKADRVDISGDVHQIIIKEQ
jgi:hypothetical protein